MTNFSYFFLWIIFLCRSLDDIILFGQEMDVKQKRGAIGSPNASVSPQCDNNSANRPYGGRSYGVPRRGIRGNFVPPIKSNGNNTGNITSRNAGKGDDSLDESTKKWSVLRSSCWSIFLLLTPYPHCSQIHSLPTFQKYK